MNTIYRLAAVLTIAACMALFAYIMLGLPTYELVTVLANGEAYADRYYTMDDCSADILHRLTDAIMNEWAWLEVGCEEVAPWQNIKNWLARLAR